MKPVPIYIKYSVQYETRTDPHKKHSCHVYAETESECLAILYKAMEHESILDAVKTGTKLQTITKQSKLDVAEIWDGNVIEQPHDAYFFWYNRKYYENTEKFRQYLLKCFEMLEEYEICTIIRDSK